MTALHRTNFRFLHHMRVRWAEVDMQKIVFNPHYLMYFDNASGDYWRALALPYEAAMVHLGGDLFVKKASVEYHASARYDDRLEVGLRCAHIGNSSLRFEGAIFRGEQLLITGELIYVFASATSQVPQRVPDVLRQTLLGYEEGKPFTSLQLGDWDALGTQASALRNEVFVQEQGIDNQMVWDAADATALHAVVNNGIGQTVASGRLLQHAPGVGRIGRMAVSRVLRGYHLGADVLTALVQASKQRGDAEVMLHAQRSAEGFYLRQGFKPRGPAFEEAGIAHQEMVLAFA